MKSSDLRRFTFDVADAPTTTATAYSAGAVIGGVRSLSLARANDEGFMLSGVSALFLSNVQPDLSLHLFNTNLPGTAAGNKGDTNVFAPASSDLPALVAILNFLALGSLWRSLGTPKFIAADNLGLLLKPSASAKTVFGVLVTNTAITLGSTSDLKMRFRGAGA